MLTALAGADALDILVRLHDFSEAGLKKVEANVAAMEKRANATNLGGFRKATQGAAADAEKAAGKVGGGGLMSMIGGFTGLPGPVGLAVVALGGFAALMGATIPTYQKVQQQEKALAIAMKDHGENLDRLKPRVDAILKRNEDWAFTNDESRASIIRLTEAGLSMSEVEAAMPHIADLARASHISLSDATEQYAKAVYGSARALKQYGIILPAVTASSADVGKATVGVEKAQTNLKTAQEELTVVEDKLKGKHTLTAAEALQLQKAHDKVATATVALKAAQDKLSLAHQGGVDKAARLKLVNDGLTKAIKDQRTATDPLQKAETKLGDAWEHFSSVVGPPLVGFLTGVINVISTLVGWIATLVGWIEDAVNWFGSLTSSAGHAQAAGAAAQAPIDSHLSGRHRATGGPVFPGQTYTVGEAGPETLLMGSRGGYVLPGSAGMRGGGGAGGGSMLVQLHHTTIVKLNEREIVRQIDRAMYRRAAMSGSGVRRPLEG